jgi:hypothetical protein
VNCKLQNKTSFIPGLYFYYIPLLTSLPCTSHNAGRKMVRNIGPANEYEARSVITAFVGIIIRKEYELRQYRFIFISRRVTGPLYLRNVKLSRTRHGGSWREKRYGSYSFLTSALHGVSGQHHAPSALYTRGNDPRYPLYRRLDGPRACLDTDVIGRILCLRRDKARSFSPFPMVAGVIFLQAKPTLYIIF